MAGVSVEKVSDCAFGASNYYEDRFDWQVTAGRDLPLYPGATADQEGSAFQDSGAPLDEQIGLASPSTAMPGVRRLGMIS